jgi:hypothetical protein
MFNSKFRTQLLIQNKKKKLDIFCSISTQMKKHLIQENKQTDSKRNYLSINYLA